MQCNHLKSTIQCCCGVYSELPNITKVKLRFSTAFISPQRNLITITSQSPFFSIFFQCQRCNRHITLYMSNVCNVMICYTYILQSVYHKSSLAHPSAHMITIFVVVIRTFKTRSHNKFQVHNSVNYNL